MYRDPEGFAEAVKNIFFCDESMEMDYEQFITLGEKHGLLRKEKYDPDKHTGIMNSEDMEIGDDVWLWVPS